MSSASCHPDEKEINRGIAEYAGWSDFKDHRHGLNPCGFPPGNEESKERKRYPGYADSLDAMDAIWDKLGVYPDIFARDGFKFAIIRFKGEYYRAKAKASQLAAAWATYKLLKDQEMVR